MSTIHGFLFQVYPYICLTVLMVGSLIRFDQNQYSWKSDSSQFLRRGLLRWKEAQAGTAPNTRMCISRRRAA